jgi:transposase
LNNIKSATPKPKAPYSAQFRKQLVQLVRTGRKPSELAQEFGRYPTSILSWVRPARRDKLQHFDVLGNRHAGERDESQRLAPY